MERRFDGFIKLFWVVKKLVLEWEAARLSVALEKELLSMKVYFSPTLPTQ